MSEYATTYKELRRSRSDRMVAGVCGGLARYFDVNPTFYRVGFVVLTLLGGAGILIYGAALLVMPNDGETESIASEALRSRGRNPWPVIGLALVGISGIVLLSRSSFHPHNSGLWIVALIVGGSILQAHRRKAVRRDDNPGVTGVTEPLTAPTARRRPAARGSVVFGGLIVTAGILGLLDVSGVDVHWDVVLGIGAVVVGLAVIAAGVFQRRIGGLAFLGLVLAGAAIVASSAHLRLGDGIGSRSYQPAAAANLQSGYKLAIGNLDLDLSGVSFAAPRQIDAHVGVGNLHVIVPDGVSVRIVGSVGLGDLNVFGNDDSGRDVANTVTAPAGSIAPQLVIDAHVGVGAIMVTRS